MEASVGGAARSRIVPVQGEERLLALRGKIHTLRMACYKCRGLSKREALDWRTGQKKMETREENGRR